MRQPRALLSSVMLAASVALAACEGDDTPPTFFDGGSDASTDVVTDGPTDSGDAGPTTRAKILAVHASPDLGAVRVCFALGLQNDGSDGVIAPILPLPKTALAPGTGGALPDLGVDLSQKALTPYVFLASKITSSTATCDALATSLVAGTDYYILPTIKNGTLTANTTVLVAMTGCVPQSQDSSADVTTCGSTYDAVKGNLAAQIFKLDRVIANTARFGASVLHVAAPANGVWTALYGSTSVHAAIHPLDGGTDEPIADGVTLDTLAPSSAASLAMPSIDQSSFSITAANPDGGAPPASVSIPLPLVYEATTGQSTGENAYFAPGVNYTFVFLGDPRASTTLDGGAFNGYALHVLAFPNDPTLPSQ